MDIECFVDRQFATGDPPCKFGVDRSIVGGVKSRSPLNHHEFTIGRFDLTRLDGFARPAGDIDGREYVTHPPCSGSKYRCRPMFVDELDRDPVIH